MSRCPNNPNGSVLCKCRRLYCSVPGCKAIPLCSRDVCRTHHDFWERRKEKISADAAG